MAKERKTLKRSRETPRAETALRWGENERLLDERLDRELEQTFPASDPLDVTRGVRPGRRPRD